MTVKGDRRGSFVVIVFILILDKEKGRIERQHIGVAMS